MLKDLVGKLVVMRVPALDRNDHVYVKLLRLEAAGLWVESHAYNQAMLDKYDLPSSASTLVLFLPYNSITYVVSSIQTIVLSEAALGLSE